MASALIRLDRDQCHVLDDVLAREWLEIDGLGGYASSTPLLCHTRRYHGLLVAPFAGNPRRHVFLSRYEESLHERGRSFALSMARYPGRFAPLGHRALDSFSLLPYPSSVYRIGRNSICRDILLVGDAPICLTRYRVQTQRDSLELRLRPLLAFREADALTFENLDLNPRTTRIEGGIRCHPYAGLPSLSITIRGADVRFDADPVWYRQIEYLADIQRGYDGHEDQFNPGTLCLEVSPEVDVVVAATIGEPVHDPLALWRQESARRRAAMESVADHGIGILRLTSRAFVARSSAPSGQNPDPGGRPVILAGFPWFGEWGRDTFIALPGLLLSGGDVEGRETCRAALVDAIPFLRDGLLPNLFGTSSADSQYGSVDAALWYALAVRRYMLAGGTIDEIRSLFLPTLRAIAEGYLYGNGDAAKALAIHCDEGGLIVAGTAMTNATWMDARVGNVPVTPRAGCAVELNGLWYFLLQFIEHLHEARGEPQEAHRWRQHRERAGKSFLERLWIADERYLADVWDEGSVDRSVRPNMVIAAALEWSPLSRGKRTDVVLRAAAELLTPRGLRTLEPIDPRYVGRYHGNSVQRDSAYHQGTVWPWLLGFYCEALLRALGDDHLDRPEDPQVAQLRHLLSGFSVHLHEAGLGHVSEVFDGDPPHHPGGCIAQAWSTAEILRAQAMLEGREL